MLTISEQELKQEARQRGYRVEILEKVYRLLDLVEIFMATPFLAERLVLKGGTAMNLFCTDKLPRLSVDLDFNYIGSLDRQTMLQEKIELEAIIIDLCRRQRYELERNPQAHAGGKMVLLYPSVLGNKGRLEVDLNYIFRIPLWEPEIRSSPAWLKHTEVSVLNLHELAAGKLHALLGREASRDLFDSHQLLTKWNLNNNQLRLAFTIYAGMERDQWQRIHIDNIHYSNSDIRDKLIPVLQREQVPAVVSEAIGPWATKLVEETKYAMSKVLPFNDSEIEFLTCLQKYAEIKPELISSDDAFCERVKRHPSLLWRARKVPS